ncbi:C1 family peptidase [Aureivirga sp. CE67]|uniref:C1 family peptidase n=1 Tax=Aureivirga sp. CE67 TaxID=1788983 RepID=UPI0018CA05F8|nr:C1 family peptidase [Aureivirga sp. CE67]
MKKILLSAGLLLATSASIFAQEYKFKDVVDIEATEVKSQGRTGTCWSFSTSSFLESEIFRLTGKKVDISEMYTVRNTYPQKAHNYVMRQGKAQFSEGGLAHDVLNSVEANGLVPQEEFSGLFGQEKTYNHAEMIAVLRAMVKTYADNPGKKLSPKWRDAINKVLDVYIGEIPEKFTYEGKEYTPESFRDAMKIDADNYVTLTTFTHQPYYESFILNIPDNFSNGSMYNLPLDEFVNEINHALENGYSIALDCDVSEKTFSAKHGVATLPHDIGDNEKSMTEIVAELNVTPENRQVEFENFNTTDDHLMHITGMVKDQKGNVYYKVKNSWGGDSQRVGNGGYIYMSAPYLKMKTISVLLHKDGMTKKMKKKLEI